MTENWKALPSTTVINTHIAEFKRLQNCDVSMLNATIAQFSKKIDDLAANAVTQFDIEKKDALKLMKATSLTAKTYINSKLTDAMTAMDVSSSEYKVYVTTKLDAAVIELDKSSLALTSLSASVLAKVQSALPGTTKTFSAIISDASKAASQTLIGDAETVLSVSPTPRETFTAY